MTTRREFLQVSMAASAIGLGTSGKVFAGQGATSTTTSPVRSLCDARIPESRVFAQRAAALGLQVHTMQRGDITPVWFHELQADWSRHPAPIIGLTTQGPLFCLEQLAPQYGMRVIFRAGHLAGAPQQLHVRGAAPLVEACRMQSSTTAWASTLPDILSACPAGLAELVETTITHTGNVFETTPTLEHGALTAWLIAPATRYSRES